MKLLSFCNRLIEYSFYALFFFVPLVFAPNTSELFELNKMWLTFVLTITIVSAWGIKALKERRLAIQRTPLDIPLLLFGLSQVISTLISLDQRTSFWGYYSRFNGGLLSTVCYLLLYYAFVSNLQLKQSLKVLLVSLFSGLAVSLWGIPAHFAHDPTCFLIRGTFDISCWTDQFQPQVRIFSTLGQPAWMASYMAFILFVFIGNALFYFFSLFHEKDKLGTFSFNNLIKTGAKKMTPFPLFLYIASAASFTLYISIYMWANAYAGQNIFFVDSIVFSLLFALSYYFHNKSLLPFFISFANVLVLFYLALNYANTRAGYIAFWIGVFIFIVLAIIRKIQIREPIAFVQKSITPIFLVLFALLLSLTFFFGNPIPQAQSFTFASVLAHFSQSSEKKASETAPTAPSQPTGGTVLESGGTESGNIRRIVWKGAVDAWLNNPIVGTGVETFAYAYYKYRPAEHNLTSEWDYLYNKAHNEYLNYLATTGILGLGAYLLFISAFLLITIKRILIDKNAKDIPLSTYMLVGALVCGFGTILIANFFGFSVVITNLYLFIIPIVSLQLLEALPNKQLIWQLNQEKKEKQLSPYQWTGIMIILLIFSTMLFTLLRYWQADTQYALGHNYDTVGEFALAQPLLLTAVQIRPNEPVFTDELAINDASLAITILKEKGKDGGASASTFAQQAIQLSDQAIASHPNNILVWKNRVRMFYLLSQANTNFYGQALVGMQKAKELGPTDAKISYNLGVLYGQTGNLEKGIAILKETLILKPNYRDAYFAMALFYHELASKDGLVIKPEIQKQAMETMRYILRTFDPTDKQVNETLKSWGEK